MNTRFAPKEHEKQSSRSKNSKIVTNKFLWFPVCAEYRGKKQSRWLETVNARVEYTGVWNGEFMDWDFRIVEFLD